MKKILFAGSALLAAMSVVSAAQAADIAPVTYDWSGFYIGANAGVAWNNSSANNNFDAYAGDTRINRYTNDLDGDQAAFTGGGLLGYNWQLDKIVLGVEADINYLGFSDDQDKNYSLNHDGPIVDTYTRSSLEADWFGTIRGRLGFAADNFLFYGTGGLAYGNVQGEVRSSIYVNDNFVDSWKASSDETNWGWTAGAGIEYGIDRWSLGLEYLYVDLGDADWQDNHMSNTRHDYDLNGNADFAFSVVRATAKVRF